MSAGLIEKKIDDSTYEFEKWGAEEATLTLIKISKMVGGPIGIAMGGMFGGSSEEKGLDKKIDYNLLPQVFEALVSKLDEKETFALIKKLSSEKMFCDGAKINFNSHYQDRLDHMFRVVYAALEVQYGNFFSGILGSVGISKSKKSSIMNQGPVT